MQKLNRALLGLPMSEFWQILCSIKAAAENAGAQIITGDTKSGGQVRFPAYVLRIGDEKCFLCELSIGIEKFPGIGRARVIFIKADVF